MWILLAFPRQCSMKACSSTELFWRTNDRISFGRPAQLGPHLDQAFDVGDDLVVVQPRRVDSKTSLPAASTLMLIASRPASTMPARDPLGDQRPVLIIPTSRIPFGFA